MVIIVYFSTTYVYSQEIFFIKGNLGNDQQGKIRIMYKDADKYVIDSTLVKNGKFRLKGKINDPTQVSIVLNPSNPNALALTMESMNDDQQLFFLEGGKITIKSKGNLSQAVIKGGKSQEDYLNLMAQYSPINIKSRELQEIGIKFKKEMNDTGLVRLGKISRLLNKQKSDIDSAFIKDNPDSYLAFFMSFKRELSGVLIDLKQIEPKLNHFDKRLLNTYAGKKLSEKINIARKLSVGQPIIDFILNDTLNNSISLSSMKGKYILLMFWCPNFSDYQSQISTINNISDKYSGKELEVISVAYPLDNRNMDDSFEIGSGFKLWKELIKQFNMKGVSLCDTRGLFGSLSKAYDLSERNLPQCYLINPDGIILERNLYPDKSLLKKIENLIPQQ